MARVLDEVYIGSYMTASDEKWLSHHGIKTIVNLSCAKVAGASPDRKVINVVVEDTELAGPRARKNVAGLLKAAKFIKEHEPDGPILVNCMAGINRSATAIGIYFLKQGRDLEDILDGLVAANKKRGVDLLTNPSFRLLLMAVRDKHSALRLPD